MKRAALAISVVVHAVAALAVARARARPAPATQVRVQVAVVETATPAPPPPPPPAPPPLPPPAPARVVKMARASIARTAAPAPRPEAPPPPSAEAPRSSDEAPVAIAGISHESTSAGGTFAVPVGNTLAAAPERVARKPAEAKPYKAERYAPAADLAEAPRVLNRDQVDIRRYYPKEALQHGVEGEVVLRLTIDSDGSIAEASVVRDPGEGLGAAALRAVREFRFAPGKVGESPVATAIPFVIRFVIS
ncbi:MAG: energy transducer TonB, partial [Myxococcales bacterium]